LIGSKRKIVTIFDELHRLGGVPREQLARVHGPIGLDIGAVTPGEIAVSIAAELIAERRRAGGVAPADAEVRAMRLSGVQLDRLLRPEPPGR
jgi:xanthine dehydrogenase accessory factor